MPQIVSHCTPIRNRYNAKNHFRVTIRNHNYLHPQPKTLHFRISDKLIAQETVEI
jgi:hypothetical protein